MKRMITALLCMGMILSMAACGRKEQTAVPTTEFTVPMLTEAPETEAPVLTEAPAEDPDGMEGVYTISDEEAALEEAQAQTEAPTEAPAEETEAPVPEETAGLETSSPVSYKGTPAEVANTQRVNVRSGPSAKEELVKQLDKGTQVIVYETVNWKGAQWANTNEGWISMNYLKLDGPIQERDPALGELATIENSNQVNVRAEPTVNSKKVTVLPRGTLIHVHETVDALGVKWGRIDEGWVSMKYVKLPKGVTVPQADSASTGDTVG